MALDMTQFYEVFFEESAEHLSTMESLLLYLDPQHPDAEQLEDLYRAAHSIRGSGGTFGFKDIAEQAQAIEAAIDKLRKASAPLSESTVAALLDACAALRTLLAGRRGEDAAPRPAAAAPAQARSASSAAHEVMALAEAAGGARRGAEDDSLREVSEAVRRLGAAIERNARLAELAAENADLLHESLRALVLKVAALALAPPARGPASARLARSRPLPKVRRRPGGAEADEEWPEF